MTHQPSNPVDSNKLSQDFAVQTQELIISRQRYYSTSSIFVLTPSLGYLLLLVKLGLEPLPRDIRRERERAGERDERTKNPHPEKNINHCPLYA